MQQSDISLPGDPAHPLEALRQVLAYSKVWERSTLLVLAVDLPERAGFEGLVSQALQTLKNPGGDIAFKGVRLILASTQSRPKLPKDIEVILAEGSTLACISTALRSARLCDLAFKY